MKMKTIKLSIISTVAALISQIDVLGAGTLTPMNSSHAAIQIRDHNVDVIINNGFTRTTINQTFYNPNSEDLEAIYAFPLPESASLSEMIILTGENRLEGEVIKKKEAERIYQEEKDQGNYTGLASKVEYQNFEFRVYPVRAQAESQIKVVYYQPLKIDTGVGRYIYPLEEGGTDEVAESFWTRNEKVERTFSATVTLKSAWPVDEFRVPNFSGETTKDENNNFVYKYESQGGALNRDFVVYYRLAENLPGRVEVIPYRADKNKPGTFMMVVTPGLDLKPLTTGADYVFLLDKSGSMQGKIHTLTNAMEKALVNLQPHDRFKIITFNHRAHKLIGNWTAATAENVKNAINKVNNIKVNNSTNLYAGINLALKDLDADRASSLIIVTDGVTNTGVVEPAKFHKLLKKQDVRLFGFLMGNSSNWPLMRVICDASGGFYKPVSNDDDIIGQIILAKSKVTHEALHDVAVNIDGVKTYDVTQDFTGKIYRGQQLILFGKYDKGGQATVTLTAKKTGADKTYATEFVFPEIDRDNPELERLWAMSKIEQIELHESIGKIDVKETKDAIADLGVQYQLVTDHTSMIVLDDESFKRHGIERRNKQRAEIEHKAQAVRNAQPVKNYRVDDNKNMFNFSAPSSSGGGAIEPFAAILMILLTLIGYRVTKQN